MEKVLSTDCKLSPLVSIIVVSCLKECILADCLASVAAQSHTNLECLVFLNCVKERDLNIWQERFPSYRFFSSFENLLYCKPQNDGIRLSRGEYVLCLNDDIILEPDYIKKALNIMTADTTIGMLSGCIMRPDGKTYDSTGLVWSKSRKPNDRGYGKKLKVPYSSGFVFGVNGAAAFYRSKMLEDIKCGSEYFDESFGIYYEDFDIAWRSQKMGWKAFYNPLSIAYHKRGATTRVHKQRLPFFLKKFAFVSLPHDLKLRLVRNRYAAIIKNDNWFSFLIDLPWILFYEARLLAYLIFFDRRVLCDCLKDLSFLRVAYSKRKAIRAL